MNKDIAKILIFSFILFFLSSCYSTKKILITQKMNRWEKKNMTNTRKKDLTKPVKKRKENLNFHAFVESFKRNKKLKDQKHRK
jgi:hypothetical protein